MSIWKYSELKRDFRSNTNFITLNEGDTPVNEIILDNKKIYIKREDKNPTGSWKDRVTAYKLTSLLEQGINEGVIFSSGNAIISMLTYITKLNLDFKLHCVVSTYINPEKLRLIKNLTDSNLIITDTPKKKAIEISAKKKIPNLRISIDNDGVIAYRTLGFEIYKIIKNKSDCSIFVPASSGTAVVGLAEGLLMMFGSEMNLPKINIIQTSKVHPFANNFEKSEENSLADAIVDTVGLRSSQINNILNKLNGKVLVVSNEDLKNAKVIASEIGYADLSYNSLLSFAGFLKDSESAQNSILISSGR